MVLMYKPAETIHVVALDCEYDVVFENEIERRNTRDDDPMVTLGQDYLMPTCRQRITIVPGRKNYFRDYKKMERVLDNALAYDFKQMFQEEPNMNMWFAKDNLSYAAYSGHLI